MNELAEKNREGTIEPSERVLLERYLRVGNFLNLIHAKARCAWPSPLPLPPDAMDEALKRLVWDRAQNTCESIRPQGPSVAVAASQGQAGPACQADPADDERQPVPVEGRRGRWLKLMPPIKQARPEAGQEGFEGELGRGDRPEHALLHVQADGLRLTLESS